MLSKIISYFSHLLMADFADGQDCYAAVYKVSQHGVTLYTSKCVHDCHSWAWDNVRYAYDEVPGTATISGKDYMCRIMGTW